jgi:hypothetical protein
MPSGFERTGHRWRRIVNNIGQEIDLKPMRSLRGLGPKWVRLHCAIWVEGAPVANLPVRTLGETGLETGPESVWVLDLDSTDVLVESVAASIQARLSAVHSYVDSMCDHEAVRAALSNPRGNFHIGWLQAMTVFGRSADVATWLDQPCPELSTVRDAVTGIVQLEFADYVLDAFAFLGRGLDDRWRAYVEGSLLSVRKLRWPTVLPWAERVTQRLALATPERAVEPARSAQPPDWRPR